MKVKKIGITGGIGSGKTTVCRIFETLGIPVYYADEEAKRIMVEDADLVHRIKETFGENSYINGVLNRAYLAKLVFKDENLLKKLNKIVHPALWRDYEKWHNQKKIPLIHSKKQPFCLKWEALNGWTVSLLFTPPWK